MSFDNGDKLNIFKHLFFFAYWIISPTLINSKLKITTWQRTIATDTYTFE